MAAEMTTTTTATDVRWLAPEEQSVWRAFLDVSRLCSDQMNRQLSDESGMSLPEYEILVALSEAPDGRLRMSELADRVLSSRSRITHTVGRMEERGHVHREACADDGRGVAVRADRRGVRTARARGARPTSRACAAPVRPMSATSSSSRRGVGKVRDAFAGLTQAIGAHRGPGPIARSTAGLEHWPAPDVPPPRLRRARLRPAYRRLPTPGRRPRLRRPLRAGPGRHAGRGELAGARLPGGRRHAAVHGPRARPVPLRRRRPRVRRPGLLVGPDDPRARAPGRSSRRSARPRRAGFSFGTPTENEVAARRGDRRPGRPGRAGAPGQLRHRGDDERRPAGPRLHRAARRREVRRPLPRARRRAARLRRAAASPRSPCPTPPASPAPPRPTRSSCRTTTSPPSRPRSPSTATGSPASSPRPPPATWASSRRSPGFTAELRRHHRRARRPADQRRGHDRVPRLRARAGTASRASTPDLFTFGKVMGGGFPAAAFGGRADVMAALAPEGPVYQAGTLSGNPVATAAGLATLRACTARGLRARATPPPGASPTPRARRCRPPASRTSCSSPARMFSVFFVPASRRRSATTTTPAGRTSPPSARSSTRCSTAASTCRPARSRRGSSPPRTTTPRSTASLDALPAAARRRRGGRRPEVRP